MRDAKRVKNSDPFLTVSQVADQVQISMDVIYDRIRRGELEVQRLGRMIRIRQSAVEMWLNWENQKHGKAI
jgi:excisionase family DNA binding protein